jgi:hypothetical protein
MMTRHQQRNDRVGRRMTKCALGALGVLIEVWAFSAGCRAAGPSSGPSRVADLPALLTSANVLSEAAMARQIGTGLRPPSLLSEPSAAPRVLLWDELKIVPLMAPPNNGMTTTGGAGK